jgi:hypothetical protein
MRWNLYFFFLFETYFSFQIYLADDLDARTSDKKTFAWFPFQDYGHDRLYDRDSPTPSHHKEYSFLHQFSFGRLSPSDSTRSHDGKSFGYAVCISCSIVYSLNTTKSSIHKQFFNLVIDTLASLL